MNKHTATPWEVDTPNSTLIARKVNGIYQYIAQCDTTMYDDSRGGSDEANAAYIVKAVNAYELDQKKIKALTAALEFYLIICGNTCYSVSRESAQEMYQTGKAALKLAGEE